MGPPVDDTGVRRLWQDMGSPRAGQPLLRRLTDDRPGPWRWWPFYGVLVLLFSLTLIRVGAAVIRLARGEDLSASVLREAKQAGFSDQQIGELTGLTDGTVRRLRQASKIRPCIKKIDTLAAEYPARTNYLYLTYNGASHDVKFRYIQIIQMNSFF